MCFFFKFFIYYLFIIFIFGCVGSSFLCEGFLQLRRVGATLHHSARMCFLMVYPVLHFMLLLFFFSDYKWGIYKCLRFTIQIFSGPHLHIFFTIKSSYKYLTKTMEIIAGVDCN